MFSAVTARYWREHSICCSHWSPGWLLRWPNLVAGMSDGLHMLRYLCSRHLWNMCGYPHLCKLLLYALINVLQCTWLRGCGMLLGTRPGNCQPFLSFVCMCGYAYPSTPEILLSLRSSLAQLRQGLPQCHLRNAYCRRAPPPRTLPHTLPIPSHPDVLSKGFAMPNANATAVLPLGDCDDRCRKGEQWNLFCHLCAVHQQLRWRGTSWCSERYVNNRIFNFAERTHRKWKESNWSIPLPMAGTHLSAFQFSDYSVGDFQWIVMWTPGCE